MTETNGMLRLGTRTVWGTIAAVGTTEGERYYWMTKGKNAVAMIDAVTVEAMYAEAEAQP